MREEKEVKDNCLYFDINKQERDSAIRYLLGSILNTRQKNKFPSNYYTFDEDVNVYLAHLLFAVSLPEYHEMAEPYLSLESSDILKWVRATEDRTIRYFIFKVNADHILIHSAIFGDLEANAKGKKMFGKSNKHYRELAKLYYEQAAAYHKRIYRKATGVGEVLDKISQYFDQYQNLLGALRRDYFEFVTNFRDQAFTQFMKQMQSYESEIVRKQKMDRFLELYNAWMKTRDVEIQKQVDRIVEDLKKLDPHFHFDWNEAWRGEGGMSDERKTA